MKNYVLILAVILPNLVSGFQADSDLLFRLGNEGGGGGDSVFDVTVGQRRLLDLVEKDELEYFIPKLRYGPIDGVAEKMGSLNISVERCRTTKEAICSALQAIGDLRFFYVFGAAYGYPRRLPVDNGNEKLIVGLIDGTDVLSSQKRAYYTRPEPRWLGRYDKLLKENIQEGYLPNIQALTWAFTDRPLEELNDEGAIHLENPVSKKQVAIQIGNLVVVSRSEFQKLDNVSKDSLIVHEAMLYTVLKLNPGLIKAHGTEPVRTYVRRLLKYLSDPILEPTIGVKQAFDIFNIPQQNFRNIP